MAWFEQESIRIYYEEDGGGDPLLLLPGWSLSIADMEPIRRALAPLYRVIAADLPGSGRSQPQPREYTANYYQDDSRAFLELLAGLAATPAHVVGCSDGGEYALLMAELEPAAVRSVVTWGAVGTLVAPPQFLEAFSRVVDDPAPPLRQFSDYLKDTYGADNARVMTGTVARAWEAITHAGGDISRGRAGEIACPALLITGEQDAVFAPPALVSEMAAAVPRAEFIEAKGAGHLVHHDSPDWLAETIAGWLAER